MFSSIQILSIKYAYRDTATYIFMLTRKMFLDVFTEF